MILDLDSKIQGYLDILGRCQKVYLPEIEGRSTSSKIESFNKALRVLGKNSLLIKMERITVPKYHTELDKQLSVFIKNSKLIE